MKKIIVFLFLLLVFQISSKPQVLTQTIKGKVFDVESNSPLPGATVTIVDSNPLKGSGTDAVGFFRIENVEVGRYDILVSYIGYKSYVVREIVVGTGKEVVLNIGLKESVNEVDEVTVKALSNKNRPKNSMTTLSAIQVNMEQANRYAGGFDDPARLVSSYAGVAQSLGNNGIVVRGNSPKGLLWRMEGVQIPNPDHFADYISLGGGAVTALSSQTMATSDFFTGAFPAEYGNALSGVFDINLRTGNTEKHEHVFQVGAVGIDFASEGPFVKGKRSSYLFNYRYSTLGLLAPTLPKEMGKLTYQDLSFKLNFPVKSGTISLWGIGAYDFQGKEAINDSLKWENNDDPKEFETRLTMGAVGLNFKKVIGTNTYFQTTLAATENSLDWSQDRFNEQMVLLPKRNVKDYKWKLTFTGFLNHKFNAKHTNRTGFIIDRLMYNMDIKKADDYGKEMVTYASEKNGSSLYQFYTQSKFTPTDRLTLNMGFHSQYFGLNHNFSFEPRVGISLKIISNQTVSFAYGLHSQVESLQLYFVEQNVSGQTIMPNKKLDFNKSHHFVMGYEAQLNDNLFLKIEPFFQKLVNIPVVPDSYISTINLKETYGFNQTLVNSGSGKNYGVDVTLERFLNHGLYYLFTASVFDSKYTGGDGIERNTAYSRNYVFNAMGGKEWLVGKGKQNLFNANIRLTYMGGNRIIPLNETETLAQKEIVEDYSRAYEFQLPNAPILSLSLSYRKNKLNHSSIWSFHLINALGHKEFQEYEFNKDTNKIEQVEDLLFIPNISYKIEF
ncbi:MAG: TonB-dependent receptor [Prolixibacteraceae bacterium]|nr:TonB-dependent receptor [Prolixibacteraceae bacterium]